MFIRDHLRQGFFNALGMDVDWFDDRVIRLTNDISQQVFPETIDLDNPKIWANLRQMLKNTQALEQATGFTALRLKASNALCFVRMFLQRPRRKALPANVRLQPAW